MFDLVTLIKTVGYIGLFGIVFAESGLLIGFFLPGDSLLFTAGFLASQPMPGSTEHFLDIRILIPLLFVAAVTGDSVGYAFGKAVGPKIFKREDSLFFNKEHLSRAHAFYERHGGKTIVLARFMPIVRTFAPIVAGVGRMHYATFLFFNVIGGALWVVSLTLGGYWLGRTIPADQADKYVLPIVFAIVILSVLPTVIHVARDKQQREHLWLSLRKVLKRA